MCFATCLSSIFVASVFLRGTLGPGRVTFSTSMEKTDGPSGSEMVCTGVACKAGSLSGCCNIPVLNVLRSADACEAGQGMGFMKLVVSVVETLLMTGRLVLRNCQGWFEPGPPVTHGRWTSLLGAYDASTKSVRDPATCIHDGFVIFSEWAAKRVPGRRQNRRGIHWELYTKCVHAAA